ncbi:von Willebrand factor type A domain protein [Penicillium canescens]|uniref:von Willebrand factor type A domain protein n=1 Tax=Penicillium canescens TaxID=5083 RepID=UPI0026E0778A|nr:von Willebrand factor type A domain protein [Penicillium canescens]KAJ6009879.1 von Willebrand factor type A domain protein [Penicillium canescens]KAJ6039907.1 von Willebrand factor type A domain protein [Penicillium canescens]KAJ6067736.1 von Willebrand factor type A domain protein [Penicillium canescens]
MDVIDRFESGLFVHQLNVNPGFIPPSQPSKGKRKYDPADRSIALPTPSLESSQETPLPLLSVSIDVDLNGTLSTTKVTQKFTNAAASAAQNARYLFPIYNGSVVTSFKCWIGPDKLLEGDVKPKEVARADFQQAVSRHKAAVLVEEVTPEIFETNLGNIPAQTTVRVEIAYTGLLKVDISTGGLVLNIPTSVAPRYGSAPEEYSAADPLPTEGLRISIHASMPAAIRKMESGTHPISVEIGAVSHQSFQTFAAGASSETFDPSKARANLADRSAVLHRDFVLFIILSSPREFMQSQAVATSQPEIPGRSTVAITINPGNLFLQMVNPDDFNGEIIFMADRSGSMERNIPSLIDVMNVFLRSLPQQCSFNIASFGSSVSWLWPVSKVYNQDQLDIATQHVAAFQANLGGTEILSALQSVLHYHDKRLDVPTNVILLTDGEVWDVDQVIRFAKNTASDRNVNIRFFALGIGDRVSHRLVEGIGQQGGGCAEIVAESSPGSWQGRVIQMLKAALTPPVCGAR